MGEWQLILWLKEHWGGIGLAAGVLIFLAVRFLPAYIQALRERRLQALDRRKQEREWQEQEKQQLRQDAKQAQAELHTILTNHIAHLQEESTATRQFHVSAVEQLREMTHQLKELRGELARAAETLDEVDGNVREVKGKVS